MRNRGRVREDEVTGIPVAREIPGMGLKGGARMRGLTNPDANRRGRRRRLWGPGPESKDIGEEILGGKIHAGSVKGKVCDAVTVKSISFAELSVGSAINSLGVLLGNLKLLELGSKDARGSNRLVVIKKHDPPMYYLLESGTSGVESILGPME